MYSSSQSALDVWRRALAASSHTRAASARLLALLDWHFYLLQSWMGLGVAQVAADVFVDDRCWGDFAGPHYQFVGGYKALIEAAAAKLDIRRGARVVQIDYAARDCVRTRCADGRCFESRHVVCALPAPVLQRAVCRSAHDDDVSTANISGAAAAAAVAAESERLPPLFHPELPAAKIDALASMRVVSYKKVFLVRAGIACSNFALLVV